MPEDHAPEIVLELTFGALTPTGLVVDFDAMVPTAESIGSAFEMAWVLESSVQWGLGDLWLFAEEILGEEAAQLLQVLRSKRSRMSSYAWVCRKFDRLENGAGPSHPDWPLRRRLALSFYHHEAVAGLVGEDARATAFAIRLLDRAERDHETTVEHLEEAVRDFRADPDTTEQEEGTVGFKVGTVAGRVQRMAAKADGILADMPGEYHEERGLLEEAKDRLGRCAQLLRKRKAKPGGGLT